MMAWPKPVQKPYPPVIVGGAFPYGARRAIRYGDGWVPHASRPEYGDVSDFLPQFQQMAKEAGRDPASLPVTMFRVVEELRPAAPLPRHRHRARGDHPAVSRCGSGAADPRSVGREDQAVVTGSLNSRVTPRVSVAGTMMRSASRRTPLICPAASAAAANSSERVRTVSAAMNCSRPSAAAPHRRTRGTAASGVIDVEARQPDDKRDNQSRSAARHRRRTCG